MECDLTPIQQQCVSIIADLNATHFKNKPFHVPAIMAFVEIESNFDPVAVRQEPGIDDASYGLMQVLGSTAKGIGFAPENLLSSATGIYCGMEQLIWIETFFTAKGFKYTDKEIVCAYNEGVGNVLAGRTDDSYWQKWQEAQSKWEEALA